MARSIKKRVLKSGRCVDSLGRWASVFTAATILANRSTRYHRDSGTRFQWYDLLMSLGPYRSAPLYLSPIGVKTPNRPGTVCAFSGTAWSHAVRGILTSRICISLYMRETMREGFKAKAAPFMDQEVYSDFIGPHCGKLNRYTGMDKREIENDLEDVGKCLLGLAL